MPRLVYLDRRGPYKVETEQGKALYICGCGLSKEKPFCDGRHVMVKDEDDHGLYVYTDQGRVRLGT